MTLKLRYQGDPILHQIAIDVDYGRNVTELIDGMREIMNRYGGMGLAANQVGVLDRVIVVATKDFRQAFINPVIERRYGGTTTKLEGCLSFRGQETLKIRHRQIKVTGFDADWQPITRKLKGWPAICVQHEIDHLDGITIL